MPMLVRSAALALAVLFGIAIVHKLRVLARGDGANEPLLQRSAVLARHSGPVLAAAASLEVAVAALLVLRPTWGFVAAVVVVGGYTTQVRRLAPDQSCHCFGEVLDAGSRDTALVRNAAIVAACVVAAGLGLSGAVHAAAVTPTVLGATLVLLSLPLAQAALRRQAAAATASRPGLARMPR